MRTLFPLNDKFMAQPHSWSWSRTPSSSSTTSADSRSSTPSREPVHLPDEIILEILSYFPEGRESQSILRSCCLISHQWHNLSVAKLYAKPDLKGWNYDPFVRTICPSKNAHIRKSDLAGLVRELDMSKLAYQGSKSITARLLGRTKASLEIFRAPQANWGINCLAALRHCKKLRTLDFSLLAEAVGYREISQTLESMHELRTLRFPRSAPKQESSPYIRSRMYWPPHLEDLTLAGSLRDFYYNDACPFDQRIPNLPSNLTSLTIQHTRVPNGWLPQILARLGQRLTFLRLNYIRLSEMLVLPGSDGMLAILRYCPVLKELQMDQNDLTIDLICGHGGLEPDPLTMSHPLRHIYIAQESRPSDELEQLDLGVLEEVMIAHGSLPELRRVTIECMFKIPDTWSKAQLKLHRSLKRRALDEGEPQTDVGIRFAVLQPS